MKFLSFKYKLRANKTQNNILLNCASVCRAVYNLALEQRRDWGKNHKINFFSQNKELSLLRKDNDWIKAISQEIQEHALQDLEEAFQKFFKGGGFPSFRKKGINESFRFRGRSLKFRDDNNPKWAWVKLPKLDWIKFRKHREMCGKIKTATISLDSLGWHISFSSEIDVDPPLNNKPEIGIDRGVANTIYLSNGSTKSLPIESIEKIDSRYRDIQRKIAFKKKGSNKRKKLVREAAKLSAKISRIRKNWHHNTSKEIVDNYGVVILENLKIKNMSSSAKGTIEEPGKNVAAKSGLNRSILNQSWYTFELFLDYKLQHQGGKLIKVNPAHTSTTCSSCGHKDKQNRDSQAKFVCVSCGNVMHADHNAAINILKRGMKN